MLQPGADLNLPLPDTGASTNLKVSSLTLEEFIPHLVPASVVEAMAQNEILQIVVFSIFAAIARSPNSSPASCWWSPPT